LQNVNNELPNIILDVWQQLFEFWNY